VPEIAFAGRSNAGKSTAINILCNQKGLAFASKTRAAPSISTSSRSAAPCGAAPQGPDHRRRDRGLLVDLPGYGYAEVSGSAKLHWQRLLGDYVQRRDQLAALILIMDSRRPFTELDVQMLEWFAPTGKPIHCILTKVDKLNRNESSTCCARPRPSWKAMSTKTAKVSRSPCSCSPPQARRHRRSQRQDPRTGGLSDDDAPPPKKQ
jgi:GTP-binding protein